MTHMIDTPCELIQEGIGVAVICHWGDRYLVCMREHCRDMNGLLQFPGGAVEPFESVEAAGSRELREESGISVHESHIQRIGVCLGSNEKGALLVTTGLLVPRGYFEHHKPVTQNCERDKHGDWQWLTREELLDGRPLMPVCAYFLKKI